MCDSTELAEVRTTNMTEPRTTGSRDAPKETGVRCPKCDCRHLIAVYTRHYGERTVRKRACRHCGHEIFTTETVTNKDPANRLQAPGSGLQPDEEREAA